jgi:hypothetical protein
MKSTLGVASNRENISAWARRLRNVIALEGLSSVASITAILASRRISGVPDK